MEGKVEIKLGFNKSHRDYQYPAIKLQSLRLHISKKFLNLERPKNSKLYQNQSHLFDECEDWGVWDCV